MPFLAQYNPFPIKIKSLLSVILVYILLPNLIIFSFCFYVGLDRPIIDIDYFVPLLLLSICRFKLSDLIIFTLFFLVFVVDILLIALQYFPFVRLQDILYLSNFIFLGPTIYRLLLLVIIILLVIEFFVITKVVKHVAKKELVLILLFIGCLQFFQTTYDYIFNKHNNYAIASSPIVFLIKHHDASFFNLNKMSAIEPITTASATKPWFTQLHKDQEINNKLLLIVNESWGVPNNPQLQEEVLKKLKAQGSSLLFLKQGEFSAIGATLAGELREICQLKPNLLDISSANKGFEHCLPNLLKKQGYKAISIHGSDDLILYNRSHWYPLAGFDVSFSGKSLNMPKDPSTPFGAVFDLDLFPLIAKAFKENDKLFYHWMTISTHAPYSTKNIKNDRFSCSSFNIDQDSEPCGNLMLQTQFFDGLADLIKNPEMNGVEVIVVGDHSPPFLNFREGLYIFTPSSVPWIHFKIK